jgi:hypothetical protein
VAVLSLAVGLAGCGAGAVHRSDAAAGTRLIVRSHATGSPVTATVDVLCQGPVTLAGQARIASSRVERFETQTSPGHDWARSFDVGPGTTCTATDQPAPPAVLHTVSGGDPVTDGGRLTGVRTTINGGATMTVDLLAGVAT